MEDPRIAIGVADLVDRQNEAARARDKGILPLVSLLPLRRP
jgi:hypothetical protein